MKKGKIQNQHIRASLRWKILLLVRNMNVVLPYQVHICMFCWYMLWIRKQNRLILNLSWIFWVWWLAKVYIIISTQPYWSIWGRSQSAQIRWMWRFIQNRNKKSKCKCAIIAHVITPTHRLISKSLNSCLFQLSKNFNVHNEFWIFFNFSVSKCQWASIFLILRLTRQMNFSNMDIYIIYKFKRHE